MRLIVMLDSVFRMDGRTRREREKEKWNRGVREEKKARWWRCRRREEVEAWRVRGGTEGEKEEEPRSSKLETSKCRHQHQTEGEERGGAGPAVRTNQQGSCQKWKNES